MRVFVTGGTGLIGTRLVGKLRDRGDAPVVLSRRPGDARALLGPGVDVVEGDPTREGPWMQRAAECDGVVHLAGENLFARRWNAEFKRQLADSRVKSTLKVVQAVLHQPRRADGQPKALVSASAVGYYGPHGDEEVTEETPPGNDFLARLCVEWEQVARSAEPGGVRCAQVRVGVVLDRKGGALAEMITPFKMFAGGPVGSGRQVLPWVHHEDIVRLFLFALDNPACTGPLNGTAPNPVINREFARALGRAMHRPALLPTPGFMLRLLLGAAADVVLNGQRAVPKKALALGYSFRYPTIDAALAELFG